MCFWLISLPCCHPKLTVAFLVGCPCLFGLSFSWWIYGQTLVFRVYPDQWYSCPQRVTLPTLIFVMFPYAMVAALCFLPFLYLLTVSMCLPCGDGVGMEEIYDEIVPVEEAA